MPWSILFTTWSEIDCGVPVPNVNTVVMYNQTSVNSSAIDMCEEGYTYITGMTHAVCQDTQQWSTVDVECKGSQLIDSNLVDTILVLSLQLCSF